MIRGTTPTLTFSIPIPESSISELYIDVVQDKNNQFYDEHVPFSRNTICSHDIDQCTFDGLTVSTTLSEEETALLDVMDGLALIQVTIIDTNNKVYKSEIIEEDVIDSLRLV